jgi:hypothetical protein
VSDAVVIGCNVAQTGQYIKGHLYDDVASAVDAGCGDAAKWRQLRSVTVAWPRPEHADQLAVTREITPLTL